MNGIYISDMEVPTKCPCSLIGFGYDMYCYAVAGIPARVKEYNECCENETKPSWCPIIPATDVAEVQHGHWVELGNGDCKCSRCGCYHDAWEAHGYYCQHCGAKMDKSEDGE